MRSIDASGTAERAVAAMRSGTMRAAARYASTHARSGAELQLHLYSEMARIRAFEHRVVDLFARKEIKGMAHSCEGQEATAVGVCAAGLLTDADYVLSHHRGHGHVLAKGADMYAMQGPNPGLGAHHRPARGWGLAPGLLLTRVRLALDRGRCLAELSGRRDGYCGGMGGSVHLADVSKGILGANGVVGASLGLGCGAGLAAKLEGEGRVAVAYFGDGASNQVRL